MYQASDQTNLEHVIHLVQWSSYFASLNSQDSLFVKTMLNHYYKLFRESTKNKMKIKIKAPGIGIKLQEGL